MSDIILRHHALRHLPNLKVDPELLTARFPSGCSMAKCTARCCQKGVWVDVAERDAIVEHAALIQAQMDASQETNPERWFDGNFEDDGDFRSGRAVGTAVANGACVFLDGERRCVLQKASDARTGVLKPFFCVVFPLVISDGVLCLDEARDAMCCAQDQNGTLTALDVCVYEFDYLLGSAGVRELSALWSETRQDVKP